MGDSIFKQHSKSARAKYNAIAINTFCKDGPPIVISRATLYSLAALFAPTRGALAHVGIRIANYSSSVLAPHLSPIITMRLQGNMQKLDEVPLRHSVLQLRTLFRDIAIYHHDVKLHCLCANRISHCRFAPAKLVRYVFYCILGGALQQLVDFFFAKFAINIVPDCDIDYRNLAEMLLNGTDQAPPPAAELRASLIETAKQRITSLGCKEALALEMESQRRKYGAAPLTTSLFPTGRLARSRVKLVEELAHQVHGTTEFSEVVSLHLGAAGCGSRRKNAVNALIRKLADDFGGGLSEGPSVPRDEGVTLGVEFALKLHFLVLTARVIITSAFIPSSDWDQ